MTSTDARLRRRVLSRSESMDYELARRGGIFYTLPMLTSMSAVSSSYA